ncbi:MOSC domain-containing protein [Nitratifractor sp.]
MRARIIRLFIAEKEKEGRTECNELDFDEKGVRGDKFYGRKPDRSVLITGRAAYELAAEHGIALEEGDLGENILLDIDPRELEPGSIVRLGEVELETVRRCPICEHLSIYDERLPRLVKDLRGVYLRVRRGGKVNLDTPATIVKSAHR